MVNEVGVGLFGVLAGGREVDLLDHELGLGLPLLGRFVQDVGARVHPAALPARGEEDFFERMLGGATLQGAGVGLQLPRGHVPAADHPATAVWVEATGVLLQVVLDFGLEGLGEHLPDAFSDDFAEQVLADEACFASFVLGI